MGNVISLRELEELRILRRQGVGIRAMARQVGVARQTVVGYVRRGLLDDPNYRHHGRSSRNASAGVALNREQEIAILVAEQRADDAQWRFQQGKVSLDFGDGHERPLVRSGRSTLPSYLVEWDDPTATAIGDGNDKHPLSR